MSTLDTLTNSDLFKGAATLVTGGFGVAWYRERRKTKKDAYTFAMDLLAQQNLRLDQMVKDIAVLNAKVEMQKSTLIILQEENAELKVENTRLKTALGERGRVTGHDLHSRQEALRSEAAHRAVDVSESALREDARRASYDREFPDYAGGSQAGDAEHPAVPSEG